MSLNEVKGVSGIWGQPTIDHFIADIASVEMEDSRFYVVDVTNSRILAGVKLGKTVA